MEISKLDTLENYCAFKYNSNGRTTNFCGRLVSSLDSFFIEKDIFRVYSVEFFLSDIKAISAKEALLVEFNNGATLTGELRTNPELKKVPRGLILPFARKIDDDTYIANSAYTSMSSYNLLKLRQSQLLNVFRETLLEAASAVDIFYKVENGIVKGFGIWDVDNNTAITRPRPHPSRYYINQQ